jgi:hypothetical protein
MRWLFRRLFWLGTGASVGFGGAMWIRAKVRRAVARAMPERVAADVGSGARRAGANVRDAFTEGRDAMRAREAELRDDYAPGAPHPR